MKTNMRALNGRAGKGLLASWKEGTRIKSAHAALAERRANLPR